MPMFRILTHVITHFNSTVSKFQDWFRPIGMRPYDSQTRLLPLSCYSADHFSSVFHEVTLLPATLLQSFNHFSRFMLTHNIRILSETFPHALYAFWGYFTYITYFASYCKKLRFHSTAYILEAWLSSFLEPTTSITTRHIVLPWTNYFNNDAPHRPSGSIWLRIGTGGGLL